MNTMTKQHLKSLLSYLLGIALLFAAMYVGSFEDRELHKDLIQSNQQTK